MERPRHIGIAAVSAEGAALCYRTICAEGAAIVMISSELPEVLAMSDRVLVMHEGELVGEISGTEARKTGGAERVGAMMTGEQDLAATNSVH